MSRTGYLVVVELVNRVKTLVVNIKKSEEATKVTITSASFKIIL